MAAIDKTYYETKEQYDAALAWAKEHGLESIVYDYQEGGSVLWNTSTPIDMYIWQHCNIKFIHDRLVEQYGQFGPCKGRILVKCLDDRDKSIAIMEEENKKLKSDLAFERTMLDNVKAEYESSQEIIKKLKEENEELKEYKSMYEGLCK